MAGNCFADGTIFAFLLRSSHERRKGLARLDCNRDLLHRILELEDYLVESESLPNYYYPDLSIAYPFRLTQNNKLLIIWRFFRIWGLVDGVDTCENMTRCMSNNYSGIGFWRSWHRSYNRWLVRYVYIPLGGKKHYILNVFVTFTFVAVWHDIQLNLLAWGWLIVLFILPEIVCTRIFCRERWRSMLGNFHIHLCAFGALLNILMMMLANLVGFAVGLDGAKEMVTRIIHGEGIFEPPSNAMMLNGY